MPKLNDVPDSRMGINAKRFIVSEIYRAMSSASTVAFTSQNHSADIDKLIQFFLRTNNYRIECPTVTDVEKYDLFAVVTLVDCTRTHGSRTIFGVQRPTRQRYLCLWLQDI